MATAYDRQVSSKHIKTFTFSFHFSGLNYLVARHALVCLRLDREKQKHASTSIDTLESFKCLGEFFNFKYILFDLLRIFLNTFSIIE